MSKFLIEESPLTFQPSLAVAIGLNEAIVLQQVQYWIANPKNQGYEQDGYKWVYNTYKEWKTGNFPFWSESTIKRTFLNLEEAGLLISIQPFKSSYDHEKYYRINYDQLDAIDRVNLTQSGSSNRHDLHITENTTENTFNEQAALPPAAQTAFATDFPESHTQNQNGKTPKESSPNSSTPPPSKKIAPKKVSQKPEPPAELKLGETFAEQTLLRMLTEYNDKKGRKTPTHWGNHVQKQLFTDGAQRLTNQQLQAAIYNCLNYNKSGLPDLAQRVKSWADKQPQFDALLQGKSNGNGKAQPFSGFDGLKLLENGEW